MSRYVLAAVMFGVAAGALAYRYIVLPFLWDSPWRNLVPGFAIALAIAGYRTMKTTREDRMTKRAVGEAIGPVSVPPIVGLGILAAVAAFALSYFAFPTIDRLSLERRDFPGFSFDLPSGSRVDKRLEYASGKVELRNVGGLNAAVVIGWEIGEKPTADELRMGADLLAKTLGEKVSDPKTITMPGPDGKPVATIELSGQASMLLSGLGCGTRYVFVATASRASVTQLHQRMLSSFVCKPDPAQEGTARIVIPLVIDLPGWYIAEDAPDQLQITDGEAALTMRTIDFDLGVDVGELVKASFKVAGIDASITGRQGDRVNITVTEEGETMDGWVRIIKCPSAAAFVIALAYDQPTLDMMYQRVDAARCLRKGEAAQQWPKAPPEPPEPDDVTDEGDAPAAP